MFCPDCGNKLNDGEMKCSQCEGTVKSPSTEVNKLKLASLQITKLVIGICSIVLSIIIGLQSSAVGIVNAFESSSSSSGSMGMLLAFCFLVAGIVGIVTRKSIAGSRVVSGFYLIGGFLAMLDVGIFSDLLLWGALSLIFGLVFLFSSVFLKGERINKATVKLHKKSFVISMIILCMVIIRFVNFENTEATTTPVSNSTTPVNTQEGSKNIDEPAEKTGNDHTLGDYIINVENATLITSEGEQYAVIEYKFTNNGAESTSFSSTFMTSGYQDGVEIEKEYMVANPFVDDNAIEKNIQTGKTVDCFEIYNIPSTDQPITIEIEEVWSFDDKILSFSIEAKDFKSLHNEPIEDVDIADTVNMSVGELYDFTKGSFELIFSEYNATWTAESKLYPNVTWILMSDDETLLHEDADVTDDCLVSHIAVGNQDVEWKYGLFYLNQEINEVDSHFNNQATVNLNDNSGNTYVIDYDKQLCYYLNFDLYRGTFLKFLTISNL